MKEIKVLTGKEAQKLFDNLGPIIGPIEVLMGVSGVGQEKQKQEKAEQEKQKQEKENEAN
jgi:hypothetical protein